MKRLLFLLKYICLWIQVFLLVTEGIKIILQNKANREIIDFILILMIGSLFFINLYEFGNKKATQRSLVSLFIQIGLCGVYVFLSGDTFIQIYYFFLLDPIFDEEQRKRRWLICIHFIAIISGELLRTLLLENRTIHDSIIGVIWFSIVYGGILFVCLIIHYFKDEQTRLQRINADMLTYSFEERQYLIEKERGEISQQLHDTIGHSLMAVLLNVRYLKAITDKPQEEKDAQIREIEKLLTECIACLRNSVTNLREIEENIDLKEEIGRVIYEFDHLGYIKIKLDYDDAADNISKRSKAAIYKTIQEGITNSIKHGNASKILIKVECRQQQINLAIQDNGSGCTDIHKSYGLKGIEERFHELSGETTFISTKNKGFLIQAVFPERMEV